MSKANVDVIGSLYEHLAKGDAAAALGLMDPKIVWNEAENFPYADRNPYIGPQAVASGVFSRLGSEWKGWAVEVEELLDAGEKVVALGRYSGVNKKTGKRIHAQMVHVWQLAGGKITKFQQYTDTAQIARAMEG